MLIEFLKVFTEENEIFYKFGRNTMIYSIHNSKGKTTLIRFILYALGYQIPATEGIGDFDSGKSIHSKKTDSFIGKESCGWI